MQSEAYIAVVRKIIAALPRGYRDATEILDISENAIHNRLRYGGDQIFPMEWALILQRAAEVTYLADYISRETDSGTHVPGIDVDADNEEIGMKLAEMVGKLGELVDAYRRYAADDVITQCEWKSLNEIAYQFKVTLMVFLGVVARVYCTSEMMGGAGECAAPGTMANKSTLCMEK
jgi:hypothetical protein